jgi:hypothetical protein
LRSAPASDNVILIKRHVTLNSIEAVVLEADIHGGADEEFHVAVKTQQSDEQRIKLQQLLLVARGAVDANVGRGVVPP